MKKYLPFLNWLPNYDRNQLGGDITAGLTVGVMLIPQGMAYAMLAGLPPVYGLYAASIPLIVYALLGTSRQLAVGPVAMVSLLVASGVGVVAEIGSPEFIALAILLALMVGIFQLLLGVFKLGFLVNFLSHPVIAGFTSAAAIIIGISQLKHLLGLDLARGKVHETLIQVTQNLDQVNIPTLIIGVSAIVIILILRKINRKIPSPLIVVLLGLLAVSLLRLDQQGVQILKDVPSGFPSFSIPELSFGKISDLLPIALAISLVGFMESYAIAKAIQRKHKNYEVDANQELIALGSANILGSFFQSFPVTGGFGRTAVNDQAGARSGMASLISAVLIILTMLFLTEYFYYLPKAILASIIMVAVFGLIDFKEAKHLWKTDRLDFSAFILTAVATLFLGIEEGIAVGVAFSILLIMYKISYPHIATLGKVPGSTEYRNIHRFDDVIQYPSIFILRLDAQLFFANAATFKDYILNGITEDTKYVVLEASVINNLDSSAVDMLHTLNQELKERDIQFVMTNVKGPVRDKMKRAGLTKEIGLEHFYLNVHTAINAIRGSDGKVFKEYTHQYNED